MKLVLLKIFVRCQNKEMAPSNGNYIDSYGHLFINSGFIFTYLVVHNQSIRILPFLQFHVKKNFAFSRKYNQEGKRSNNPSLILILVYCPPDKNKRHFF